MVASTATAMAIPTPILLMVITSARAKAAKTGTMIRAGAGDDALLDGLLLQRVEAADGYRSEDSLRRARSVLDVLLAAAHSERPVPVPA